MSGRSILHVLCNDGEGVDNKGVRHESASAMLRVASAEQ